MRDFAGFNPLLVECGVPAHSSQSSCDEWGTVLAQTRLRPSLRGLVLVPPIPILLLLVAVALLQVHMLTVRVTFPLAVDRLFGRSRMGFVGYGVVVDGFGLATGGCGGRTKRYGECKCEESPCYRHRLPFHCQIGVAVSEMHGYRFAPVGRGGNRLFRTCQSSSRQIYSQAGASAQPSCANGTGQALRTLDGGNLATPQDFPYSGPRGSTLCTREGRIS
jgi:hypothetical protein